jgi:hypothetical protein
MNIMPLNVTQLAEFMIFYNRDEKVGRCEKPCLRPRGHRDRHADDDNNNDNNINNIK